MPNVTSERLVIHRLTGMKKLFHSCSPTRALLTFCSLWYNACLKHTSALLQGYAGCGSKRKVVNAGCGRGAFRVG